jgi:hypothetical protein
VAFKQSNLLSDYNMTKYYEKHVLANLVTMPFSSWIMIIFRKTKEKVTLLLAHVSSNFECRIIDCLGQQFLGQFEPEQKFSCGDWQDIGLPCIHA